MQITRSCVQIFSGKWKFMENLLRKSLFEKFELSRDDVRASLRRTKWLIKGLCLKHFQYWKHDNHGTVKTLYLKMRSTTVVAAKWNHWKDFCVWNNQVEFRVKVIIFEGNKGEENKIAWASETLREVVHVHIKFHKHWKLSRRSRYRTRIIAGIKWRWSGYELIAQN